jgi:hypothetical protein
MLIGDIRYVPRLARWAALGIFALLSLIGVVWLRKDSFLYLLMIGLPSIVTFILLPWRGFNIPHYQEKQFVVLAPVAWTLTAIGLDYLWRHRFRSVQVVALGLCTSWIILSALALNRYFSEFVKSNEQAVVNWLRTKQVDQQPILTVGPPGVGGALKYYAPEIHFLYLRRGGYRIVESFWTPDQVFEMVPSQVQNIGCVLDNLSSSQDFWIVEYLWLNESASFVHSAKQVRRIELVSQIGNWQIYYAPAVPGTDKLRCKYISPASGEYRND